MQGERRGEEIISGQPSDNTYYWVSGPCIQIIGRNDFHCQNWQVDYPALISQNHGAACTITVLPSGSIIAAARADKFSPSPSRSYGWVIKVDKDGCLDTISCAVTDVFETELESFEIKLFPNPASYQVTFKWPLQTMVSTPTYLVIFDSTGKLTREFRISDGLEKFTFSVEQFPSGIYFFQLLRKGEVVETGKFIIRH